MAKTGAVDERKVDVEVRRRKRKKPGKTRVLKTVVSILIIIAIVYILTSTKSVEVTEQKNQTGIKAVTEQQPYVIVEEYQETVPLGPPRCGNTQMNFTSSAPWVYIENGSFICAFNLTNIDVKAGTWEYRAYSSGVTGNRYDKETVSPNETVTFRFVFSTPISLPCGISVESLPSVERCYFPQDTFYTVATKTRNVTKYKNITVNKEVTFLNETTVTRSVNRFFGFPMLNFGW
jgi:hypothetical protein